MCDHYAEIEECSGGLYRSAISHSGHTLIEPKFGSSFVDRQRRKSDCP